MAIIVMLKSPALTYSALTFLPLVPTLSLALSQVYPAFHPRLYNET